MKKHNKAFQNPQDNDALQIIKTEGMTPKKYVETLKKLQKENWTEEKVKQFNEHRPFISREEGAKIRQQYVFKGKKVGSILQKMDEYERNLIAQGAIKPDALLLAVYREMWNKSFWEGGSHGLRTNITEYLKSKQLI